MTRKRKPLSTSGGQLLLPTFPRLAAKKEPSPRRRAKKEHAERLTGALYLASKELVGLPPAIVHKGFILGTRFARALDEWRPEVLASMVRWWIDHRHLIRQEYAYFAKSSPALYKVWRRADEAYHESLKAALPPACARELVSALVARMGGLPMSEDEAQEARYAGRPRPPLFVLPPLPSDDRAAARTRVIEAGEAADTFVPRLAPGRPRTGPATNPTARHARPRARVNER